LGRVLGNINPTEVFINNFASIHFNTFLYSLHVGAPNIFQCQNVPNQLFVYFNLIIHSPYGTFFFSQINLSIIAIDIKKRVNKRLVTGSLRYGLLSLTVLTFHSKIQRKSSDKPESADIPLKNKE
jgi:hypothetical protein